MIDKKNQPSEEHLTVYIKLLMSAVDRVLTTDVTDKQHREDKDELRRLVFKLKGVVK